MRYMFGRGAIADLKRGGALLEKACDLEDATACVMRSNHHRFAIGVGMDLAKAHELAARGCDLGAWSGCTSAGAIEEKRGQREQANEHFTRACRNLPTTGVRRVLRKRACDRADALEERAEKAVAVGRP